MIEKPIESYLAKETTKLGCLCWKFTSPGRRGMPDRIIICPERWLEFVETKRPKGKPKPLQRFVHKLLAKMGFKVWVIDTHELVDEFIIYLKARLLC